MELLDRRVVQCNYAEPAKIATEGARAYVVLTNPGGGHDRVQILARSRGGRWVRKWERITRLRDFRAKTLPLEHPLWADERLWGYEAEQTAAKLNEARQREIDAKKDHSSEA